MRHGETLLHNGRGERRDGAYSWHAKGCDRAVCVRRFVLVGHGAMHTTEATLVRTLLLLVTMLTHNRVVAASFDEFKPSSQRVQVALCETTTVASAAPLNDIRGRGRRGSTAGHMDPTFGLWRHRRRRGRVSGLMVVWIVDLLYVWQQEHATLIELRSGKLRRVFLVELVHSGAATEL